MILISLTVFAAGVAGFALFRTLMPLVAEDEEPGPEILGGRTRAALEREKMLALRAIKDLEFDRAMGKVSESDFREMSGRLRSRAIRLIRQLDHGTEGYRELIERELAARVGKAGGSRRTVQSRSGQAPAAAAGLPVGPTTSVDADDTPAFTAAGAEAPEAAGGPVCPDCSAVNDIDARFC